MGKLDKIRQYHKDYGLSYTMRKVYYRYQIKYKLGKRYCPIHITKQERQEQSEWKPAHDVKISIVVPLYNTAENFLREMIESVIWQTYNNWELCLADASDTMQKEVEGIVAEYQQHDKRILYRQLPSNDGISNNTNHALAMTRGEYIALMDHDDILHPSALYWVMREISDFNADFVYTDELSFVKSVERVQSIHFKPDFSIENFRNNNYICHFTTFRKDLLEQSGRFRKEFDGSQDYDLFLRLIDVARDIRHVPKVLYYWRLHAGSVASGVSAKPYTIEAGRKALEEHLRRNHLPAIVESSKEYGPFYKVTYNVPEESKVIVLAEDEETAEWVREDVKDVPYDVLVVVLDENVDIVNNVSLYDYVLFMRRGYSPLNVDVSAGWMNELLQCLQPICNLIASTVVYKKTNQVYQAGYCFDNNWNEKIRPLYRNVPVADPAYMNRLCYRQNVSLLSGAVLAVKTDLFIKYIKSNLAKGVGQWNGRNPFADQTWFALCLNSRKEFGDCVISPYQPFVIDGMGNGREYSGVKDALWQQFFEEYSTQFDGHDSCYNTGMNMFGKYYFLW